MSMSPKVSTFKTEYFNAVANSIESQAARSLNADITPTQADNAETTASITTQLELEDAKLAKLSDLLHKIVGANTKNLIENGEEIIPREKFRAIEDLINRATHKLEEEKAIFARIVSNRIQLPTEIGRNNFTIVNPPVVLRSTPLYLHPSALAPLHFDRSPPPQRIQVQPWTDSESDSDSEVAFDHNMLNALAGVVQALENKTDDGFLGTLQFMAAETTPILFMMTPRTTSTLPQRIYYHLYQIHVQANKFQDGDDDYGLHAYQSEMATPEEKLRAAQRTLIEYVIMEMIENTQLRDRDERHVNLTDLLEKMKFDSEDLPKGKTNLAHYLYEKLYYLYKEKAETNKTLLDPDDSSYNGEFGRQVFRATVKLNHDDWNIIREVLIQVADELKQKWGMK